MYCTQVPNRSSSWEINKERGMRLINEVHEHMLYLDALMQDGYGGLCPSDVDFFEEEVLTPSLSGYDITTNPNYFTIMHAHPNKEVMRMTVDKNGLGFTRVKESANVRRVWNKDVSDDTSPINYINICDDTELNITMEYIHGVDYIWHDTEFNKIYICGTDYNCRMKAMQLIVTLMKMNQQKLYKKQANIHINQHKCNCEQCYYNRM